MKLTFEAVAERVSADEIIKMIISEVGKRYKLTSVEELSIEDVATAADSFESGYVVEESTEKVMSKKEAKAAKKQAKNRE